MMNLARIDIEDSDLVLDKRRISFNDIYYNIYLNFNNKNNALFLL